MESENRSEISQAAVPLVMILLPPTIKLFKSVALGVLDEEKTQKMEELLNWVVGKENEIADIAGHNKDFNLFLQLLLDFIYDIRHVWDYLFHDFMLLQVEFLQHCDKGSPFLVSEPSVKNSTNSNLQADYICIKNEESLVVDNSMPPPQFFGGRALRQLLSDCQTFPYLEDSVVMGRRMEKDKKILEWFYPGKNASESISSLAIIGESISSLAIIGKDSLGRTSLARLMFNDDQISNYFDVRIWICVGNKFDNKDIVRRIVALTTKAPNRLLLVLDDVWNLTRIAWKFFKFNGFALNHARVIITTRNVSVAEAMETKEHVHLALLSEVNSMEVLNQCTFQYHSPENLPNLMKMGEGIAMKWWGLPLVFKAFAKNIRFKHVTGEWVDAIPTDTHYPDKLPDVKNMVDQILIKHDKILNFENSLSPSVDWNSERLAHQKLLYGRETTPYLEDLVVIGREKEKKKILDWLSLGTNTSNNFSVIAIVGQGGLGKTTLAQLVFNDEWVSKYFNLKIWICVSSDFNVLQFKRRMICCANHQKKQKKLGLELGISENNESLDFDLMSKLEGKKLLLVLDDVWNEDPSLWESLKAPLLAAEYARVIVTTRNVAVAEIMQTTDPVRPAYLSEKMSLEILRQCAFQYHCPEKLPYLMEMGKHIVKKCGGLPLAVRTLATYLRFKHDGVEHIDSIPNEVLIEKIFPSLKISYDHLSIQLKCCFIYCSMFPACYGFTKDELVRLWIAQGYIMDEGHVEGKDPMDVEGIGNKCFEKLHKNSFFDFSHCEDNRLMVFTIPIFIHALAKHIAGNEYLALDELQNLPKNVRHLYVGSPKIIEDISLATAMELSTFVLHATRYRGSLDFILDMTRVRALVLTVHNVHELPGSIGKVLKSLRYLRIKSYLMKELPRSIINLCHLQLLDVSYCVKLKELPREMGMLINLRTLCLNGCTSIQELPNSVGYLSLLQNLHLVGSSRKWMDPVIRELTNLKRLHYKRTARFINSDSIW